MVSNLPYLIFFLRSGFTKRQYLTTTMSTLNLYGRPYVFLIWAAILCCTFFLMFFCSVSLIMASSFFVHHLLPLPSLLFSLPLSLGDIFSDFRHMGMAIFGIDPLRQYTTPSFAFKSALKTTGIHIDLLTDSTEYMFFEKSLYGGISYVAHREGIANAKHLPNFQPEAPITHLEYVDVNNLVID